MRQSGGALWAILRDGMLRIAPHDEGVVYAEVNDPVGLTAHRVRSQASATSLRRRGESATSGSAQRRTAARSLSRVRYSTGDLPSTRARNKAGSKAAARASISVALSQSTPARYASANAEKAAL